MTSYCSVMKFAKSQCYLNIFIAYINGTILKILLQEHAVKTNIAGDVQGGFMLYQQKSTLHTGTMPDLEKL